jgi:hypothetical protein
MTGLSLVRSTSVTAAMARRRGAGRLAPWCFVLAGVVITAALTASIQIAGAVTNLRGEILALQQQCDELAARQAVLAVDWNTETSRQRIMRRAERELSLVCPDVPGLLLVAKRATDPANDAPLVALDLTPPSVPAAVAGERP